MTTWETFAWGFLGSVAVEIVTLLSFYSTRATRLPVRYRRVGFWVTRTILAALAGLLAVAYKIDKRILAFNVGAATPLIVTFMARGVKRASTPQASAALAEDEVRETTRDAKPDRKPTGSARG
jgi:hypothetical protein